ncbi:PAT1 multi-domain protein [Pyrenophora tritici-repentis]|nr:PAT1 multi-domain protein [Pyrenophora tritici-repentis]
MIDAPPLSPSRPARLRNPSHSAATMPPPRLPHAAQPDPSFSLLLSLPRELRDRVYQFALVSRAPFWWPGKAPELATIDHRNVNVALLRANKQVYTETVDILYSQNKFLFTHPSDLNIFRVVTPPASTNITSVLFRIREKDLRIWTAYLGSRKEDRSLRHDLPKLRSVWVFLRCGTVSLPPGLQPVPAGAAGVGAAAMTGHVQATHHTLGQLHHSIAQVLGQGGGQLNNMNHIPPPLLPSSARHSLLTVRTRSFRRIRWSRTAPPSSSPTAASSRPTPRPSKPPAASPASPPSPCEPSTEHSPAASPRRTTNHRPPPPLQLLPPLRARNRRRIPLPQPPRRPVPWRTRP